MNAHYETWQVESLRLILLVDTPIDSSEVEGVLFSSGIPAEITQVSGADALESVLGDPPDLIVAHFPRPDVAFVALLARIRERHPFLPVILVSEPIGEELTADLFRQGISDFVLRGNWPRLSSALLRGVQRYRLLPPTCPWTSV